VGSHPAAAATPALPGARRRAPHRSRPGLHGRDPVHGPHQTGASESKLHLASEGSGLPLAVLVTAANTPDAAVFAALLEDIPKVQTPADGRRCRPDKCHADKAYDQRRCRGYLTRRGIKVRIARRGVESSQRLGRHRWKAERSIAVGEPGGPHCQALVIQ